MADRSILYRLRAALQGGFVSVANEVELLATFAGVVTGSNSVETGLQRLDGTGVGAPIFTRTSSYTAQGSNIDEWFGGRQQTRIRFTDDGPLLPPTFTLPGATALGTAFDQLVTAGLPETIRFIIEYTGPSSAILNVVPRDSLAGTPQIAGTSRILVRSNIMATLEVTRSGGVISNYIFQAIGVIGDTGGSTLDNVKFINPATDVWDASASGPLPDVSSVVKGNAYRVVNAPSDGSGRFGEVMRDGDRVVVEAETFTSWTATTPRQWSVLPLDDVRRITALEQDFLNTILETPKNDRNTIVRGANYADSVNEIRMKIYATRAAYDPSDLNTTGIVDQYNDAADQTGFLAIRLPGSAASLATVLPSLYIYNESDNTSPLLNLYDDFTHRGDFGGESDYLANDTINYNANDVWRIYSATIEERYNSPDLDVFEANLSDALQAKVNRTDPNNSNDEARIATLESQVSALYPLRSYVTDLESWGDLYNPELSAGTVDITTGYSLLADYRGDGTRYESAGVTYSDTGTNVVTYTGLGDSLFRGFGFNVPAPSDQVLLWIVDGSDRIPFVDMTSGGLYRINNYTAASTEDERVENQGHSITTITGQQTLRAGTTDTATFTVTPFPTNASQTSRSGQLGLDVFVNGSDTQAEHLQSITLPADNTAQAATEFDASIFLGPLHQSRTVNVRMSYTARVSGSDLLVDVQLITAPTDVTIHLQDVYVFLSYTAPATTARVDNFVNLQGAGGDYVFTGQNELLISFHPNLTNNTMDVVPAAVDSTGSVDLLNDGRAPVPANHFDSVEIPDQTALAGFEFRTFAPDHYLTHNNLGTLLTRRATQWVYGLALLRAVTEHAVTELVDFTQGVVLVSPNDTRYTVTVADDGTLKTDPA